MFEVLYIAMDFLTFESQDLGLETQACQQLVLYNAPIFYAFAFDFERVHFT